MIKTRPVEGIVPVVSTPLTKDEKIDNAGLKRLIEFLINKEIGGLWVLGTGSEDMNLTFSKRLEVARCATEANKGKVPLILGAGFFAMEEILDFIHETRDLEFDAYHVMPYHPLLSLDRLEWFYKQIADRCSKPLWMYTSGNWSRAVTYEFVSALKDHPNIAGIKFSNTNAVEMTKVIALADSSFQVITAVAGQLYACLAMGSRGHTSSLGSCLPEMLIDIYDLFKKGDLTEAKKAQLRLNEFLKEFGKFTKKDNFLQAADEKYILKLRGICEDYVTSYYRQTSEEEKEKIKSLIDKYKLF
ncbi:MAG: dihydrodipicolinate synthase family protein [Deltaproteobacteria bacterium]|nr:dihydrodipicolinate synthase family protein [Deltaproteobacteria bacterium]